MGKVYYRQRVEGVDVPGIIHNSSYFFNRLAVYEDGIVSCWHKSDLEQFREDLRKSWVVPSVPIGESLSIFHLGNFPILDAHWQYDEQSFYDHIVECVREQNPEMENLYRTTKREIEKWNKHHISWSASPTPCRLVHEFGYELSEGGTSHIFYRENGRIFLTGLTVYQDKTVLVEHTGDRAYTIEEIHSLFQDKVLCTEPRDAEWVDIEGLGSVLFGEALYAVDAEEKYKDILGEYQKLIGLENSRECCMEAYYEYLIEPSDWNREELRKAYEAVPEHERIYLGDMDTKDWDFIRILERPEEKREV